MLKPSGIVLDIRDKWRGKCHFCFEIWNGTEQLLMPQLIALLMMCMQSRYFVNQYLYCLGRKIGNFIAMTLLFESVCDANGMLLIKNLIPLLCQMDMPVEAFTDFWATIKDEKSWTGMAKNRCKNGNSDRIVLPNGISVRTGALARPAAFKNIFIEKRIGWNLNFLIFLLAALMAANVFFDGAVQGGGRVWCNALSVTAIVSELYF